MYFVRGRKLFLTNDWMGKIKKLMMKKNSTYDMKLPSFFLQIRRSRMLGKRDKTFFFTCQFDEFFDREMLFAVLGI